MRKLRMRTTANRALVAALGDRWIPISDLSEILRLPSRLVYDEICNLARDNASYVLLLRDAERDPHVLILDRGEWRNLLRYLSLLKPNS